MANDFLNGLVKARDAGGGGFKTAAKNDLNLSVQDPHNFRTSIRKVGDTTVTAHTNQGMPWVETSGGSRVVRDSGEEEITVRGFELNTSVTSILHATDGITKKPDTHPYNIYLYVDDTGGMTIPAGDGRFARKSMVRAVREAWHPSAYKTDAFLDLFPTTYGEIPVTRVRMIGDPPVELYPECRMPRRDTYMQDWRGTDTMLWWEGNSFRHAFPPRLNYEYLLALWPSALNLDSTEEIQFAELRVHSSRLDEQYLTTPPDGNYYTQTFMKFSVLFVTESGKRKLTDTMLGCGVVCVPDPSRPKRITRYGVAMRMRLVGGHILLEAYANGALVTSGTAPTFDVSSAVSEHADDPASVVSDLTINMCYNTATFNSTGREARYVLPKMFTYDTPTGRYVEQLYVKLELSDDGAGNFSANFVRLTNQLAFTATGVGTHTVTNTDTLLKKTMCLVRHNASGTWYAYDAPASVVETAYGSYASSYTFTDVNNVAYSGVYTHTDVATETAAMLVDGALVSAADYTTVLNETTGEREEVLLEARTHLLVDCLRTSQVTYTEVYDVGAGTYTPTTSSTGLRNKISIDAMLELPWTATHQTLYTLRDEELPVAGSASGTPGTMIPVHDHTQIHLSAPAVLPPGPATGGYAQPSDGLPVGASSTYTVDATHYLPKENGVHYVWAAPRHLDLRNEIFCAVSLDLTAANVTTPVYEWTVTGSVLSGDVSTPLFDPIPTTGTTTTTKLGKLLNNDPFYSSFKVHTGIREPGAWGAWYYDFTVNTDNTVWLVQSVTNGRVALIDSIPHLAASMDYMPGAAIRQVFYVEHTRPLFWKRTKELKA